MVYLAYRKGIVNAITADANILSAYSEGAIRDGVTANDNNSAMAHHMRLNTTSNAYCFGGHNVK